MSAIASMRRLHRRHRRPFRTADLDHEPWRGRICAGRVRSENRQLGPAQNCFEMGLAKGVTSSKSSTASEAAREGLDLTD